MAVTGKARGRTLPPPPGEARRVCILTGGGDAPGLNAVIRAFTKAAVALDLEVLGAKDGFAGLVEEKGIVPLDRAAVQGILPIGGSILGCNNRANPFAYPTKGARGRTKYVDVSDALVRRVRSLHIDTLVLVGGDGTMSMGLALAEKGLSIVGIPKTIDNDLAATDRTFGFDTAVDTATWAIDALHTTAETHDRVMILEVMGRTTGWIAMHAGISGGADIILIPEIPYDIRRVKAVIRRRAEAGAKFSIIVIGEGAYPKGAAPSKITKGRKGHLPRLGGAGQHLASLLEGGPNEVRVTVLGHLQRGGSPSHRDRLLGTSFGVKAAQLCAAGEKNVVVALKGSEITTVPLDPDAARTQQIDPDGVLVATARAIGIEVGG